MSSNKDYMRVYMLQRYYRRRAAAIEQLGGKCVDCGSIEDLQFDHADAKTKTRDVGKIFSGGSEAKVQTELLKCVLRCPSCHKAKSLRMADIAHVPHGGGKTGKKRCYCELCGPLKRQYNKERKLAMKNGTWKPTGQRSFIPD